MLRVWKADGTIIQKELRIRNSVKGPVLAEREHRAVAIHVPDLDVAGMLAQWWAMGTAQSLEEFEAALRRLQVFLFTMLYADRAGRFVCHFGARVPVRPDGDFLHWRFTPVMRGDTSAKLAVGFHSYEKLPRVVDPSGGWPQDTNDPPWLATLHARAGAASLRKCLAGDLAPPVGPTGARRPQGAPRGLALPIGDRSAHRGPDRSSSV
jgi:acyl-homoserine-lactone acylase